MALPMNMSTWGFSPNVVNIAAAHAGCSCDPHHEAVSLTYRVTVSLAYVAMPLAAWFSYACPCHDLHVLGALAAVQALAFLFELLGAANIPVMSCTPGARVALASCVVIMRATDTYVTAMLFRVVAQRTSDVPQAQRRATLVFGQLLVLATLAAGLFAVLMVHSGVIVCRLSDDAANANASIVTICPQ